MDAEHKLSETYRILLQSGEFSPKQLADVFADVRGEHDLDYLEVSDLLCELLPEERWVTAEAYRGFANVYDYRSLLEEMREATQGAWPAQVQVSQYNADQVVISFDDAGTQTEITASLDGLGSLDLDALFAIVQYVHRHSEMGFVVSPAGEAYMLFSFPSVCAEQLNRLWL